MNIHMQCRILRPQKLAEPTILADFKMAATCRILHRGISTTCVCYGKRNFRKFQLYNKRGSRLFKEAQAKNPNPDIPIYTRGVKPTGYQDGDQYVTIPEMIPELVVPSLEDFALKPYVSYAAKEVVQEEFTPEDLFNVVYAPKIIKDYEKDQLGPNGEPLNPSDAERLTSSEAKKLASRTGSDIF
ncbi:39S ribosomal protein L41, mitochondrial [Orussus abietinus]|uniref:39S ribosomal protein L41, mitochondrial n=1 Tax=Orussus abietinus TaxID=222816 RepID=UPI00062698D3|nr:39S ribosomal protein L41, mitochondrial [Orussus abietinus]